MPKELTECGFNCKFWERKDRLIGKCSLKDCLCPEDYTCGDDFKWAEMPEVDDEGKKD